MFYGPMMTRQHLIGSAAPALEPLFEAYAIERQRGEDWRREIERSMSHPSLKAEFDKFQNVGLFSIAQCISLMADNVARVYCRVRLGDEDARTMYGDVVALEFPFGKLLWAAGNAARHYSNESFWKETEKAVSGLGIDARDESTAFQLLERAGIRTLDDLLAQLNEFCEQVDAEVQRRGGCF